ncbi:transcription factor Adf-1-like [Solea solea]|uniref:transcription factor Adf-1-like n=1 Tax=Solea solea TaxID=90069 RepID=UPI00272975F8|nr:transcription factor Adf-1-like [Solea solea]
MRMMGRVKPGAERIPQDIMDQEQLISEVEKYPIFYDPTHPYYTDNVKKEKTWITIATVLGADADLCRNRWRTLRDTYVRYRKKRLSFASAGGAQKEWRYTDSMSFLNPHIYQRSSKRNLRALLNEEERSLTPLSHCGSEEEKEEEEEEQPCGSSSAMLECRPLSASPVSSKSEPVSPGERDRPRSRSPRERRSAAPTETLANPGRSRPQPADSITILQAPPKPESAVDECYYFSLSIAPLLLKMDHSTRQQTKVAIMNTIISMENGTAGQTPPHPT